MKKVFAFSLGVLIIVLGFIFHEEILSQFSENEVVRSLTSKMMGVEPADTAVVSSGEDYYAYSTLNDAEKLVYDQMADCLLNFKEEVTLSTQTESEADTAFQCLISDHPEIFWSAAYELSMYNMSGVDSEYVFKPSYSMTKEEAGECQTAIDQYVSECMAGLDGMTTEYEKAKYLYEFLVLQTDYNPNAENNQNICSVFLDKQSVCMGYSKAYSYLLQKAGIQSTVVSGRSKEQPHAWNLVRLDGAYCYVDVTWGDPAFSVGQTVSADYIDYIFFGITTDELLKTHTLDNVFAVPECTSEQNQYFKREGLYLETFDKAQIGTILENHFAQSSYVTLCAADSSVYREMYHYLIDQSGIASYVDGDKINYAENEIYHTLTIFKP